MNAVASQVISELAAAGIRCELRGGSVALKGKLRPELIERARAVKTQLIATLQLRYAAAEACRGLASYIKPRELLAKLTSEEITELETDADPLPFLQSLAISCIWNGFRCKGVAPPGWNSAAYCDRCGPVLLWSKLHVAGCPWCWNRIHGIRIPRPVTKGGAPK